MPREHPRTVLLAAATGLFASLAGPGSGVLAGAVAFAVVSLRLGSRRRALTRLLPLASALAVLLVLLPFAPASAASLAVRGLAASLVAVAAALSLSWPAAVGELQSWGLPRAAVAFLAVLSRHLGSLAEAAGRTGEVVLLRGGFDRARTVPRAVGVLVGRLLALAFHRADAVADALALRGFEGRMPPPPPWRPTRAEARGLALAAVLAAAAIWQGWP